MKNMKNTITKLFAGAALLSLVLAGCSSLKEESGVVEKDAIKFTASIGSYQVKATDTVFEEGDVIGLFAEYPIGVQNLPMTWSNGSLVPETPVYWGSNQFVDQASAFYAYYPYSAVQNDIYVEGFTVQEDQTTHEGYTASDLMIASTLASPAEGTVNLNFIHRMTKLVFHVENRLTDENVAAITVGNVYVSANGYFGLEGEIYSTGAPGSVKAGKITLESGETAWQAIIAPFQYVKPAILITMESGKEYVYNADFDVYFSPSRCYNATVIIDETSVSTDFTSNITDWWDGGWFWFSQNVPSPYDGAWSLIGTVYDTMWDTDFWMDNWGDNIWYCYLEYHEGQEFKFRMNADWTMNFGGSVADVSDWQTMLQVGEANALVQDGPNMMLPVDGYYHIYLNTSDQTVTVYYEGELPSSDGYSVSDIIYLEDGTEVVTTPSLVMAKCTKGVIIADEKMAVYAYGATPLEYVKVGDMVVISGKKTTYNGVPEITDISAVEVKSSYNQVNYPTPIDITGFVADYNPGVAEFVSLTGTLSKSGNYYNLVLDGTEDKIGSMVYPAAELEADSYDGKKISVKGYFNGLSGGGKYINIVAVAIAEAGAVQTAGITIDGDFSDWDDVPGAPESDSFKTFKIWNDADNFYLYVETDPGSRLWSGGAYLYLYFDFDNDLTTGAYSGSTGMGSNSYEAYCFMYLFGGDANAPKIENNPNGGSAKGMSLDNIVIAGNNLATSTDLVKMEIVIPRSNFDDQVTAGSVIGVGSYRSKDGGSVFLSGYVVK